MNFFAVDSMLPRFMSRYDDGVLGLAPTPKGSYQEPVNFMFQLQKNGLIESNIFSIYYSDLKDSGHINFGSWE